MTIASASRSKRSLPPDPRMLASRLFRTLSTLGVLAVASPLGAQQPRPVTSADYDRAKQFLAPALNGMVVGGAVTPVWAADGRFWYRNTTLAGTEIVVIDPAARTRKRCDANATECEGLSMAAPGVGSGRGGRGGG